MDHRLWMVAAVALWVVSAGVARVCCPSPTAHSLSSLHCRCIVVIYRFPIEPCGLVGCPGLCACVHAGMSCRIMATFAPRLGRRTYCVSSHSLNPLINPSPQATIPSQGTISHPSCLFVCPLFRISLVPLLRALVFVPCVPNHGARSPPSQTCHPSSRVCAATRWSLWVEAVPESPSATNYYAPAVSPTKISLSSTLPSGTTTSLAGRSSEAA